MSIDFKPGSVHVLFGENGAGKSTLIGLLSGVHQPDKGQILIGGEATTISSPREARELGVSTVFQDPALIPQLTVCENLTLGREPLKRGFLQRRRQTAIAVEALERIGSRISVSALASDLSRADQQVVEIARALQGSARLLILDEPTATLTEEETERLFAILERLRADGIAMIYITHRMGEIRRIGDEVSILRDGALVRTTRVADVSDRELVELMTGRRVDAIFPEVPHRPRDGGLEFRGVSGGSIEDITFHVKRGEIVGLTGLVGSGKGEVGKLCFGLSKTQSGEILIDGSDVGPASPEKRLKRGIIYYPGDRKRDGLIGVRSARENVTLSSLDEWQNWGFLNRASEKKAASDILAKLHLRPANPDALPTTFSGGNQQKIVLGRGFTRSYAVHVFDEPTAGVDVGARAEIYDAIMKLAESGAAVLVISSDLPEIVNLSHRAYVVAHGQIVGEFSGEELSEKTLLPFFFHEPTRAVI
ncbi:sugar ABC transporter ATP-binding protein [Ensifer adhaerens]|uniref:sugar ABC transporter ATP-binding protein n=1 Tax=Ensifer adhaerens TaxID=106592 RepID=UPI00069F84F4|nr:sugar ABC transporter ATP-binding protein [Ensifer adhaerens]